MGIYDADKRARASNRYGRRWLSDAANDETGHLEVLEAIADSGITPAERLLEKFHGEWEGNIAGAFHDCAYF